MLATELKTGKIFKQNNQPYIVEKYEHSKIARSGGVVKIKARNLITNQIQENTFSTTTKIQEANVLRKNAQFLYKEGDNYNFMDPNSYNQFFLSSASIGQNKKFLLEGEEVQVLYFENEPVSITLPNTMNFKIAHTEPGHKGNTVTNVQKPAKLENQTMIKVPTFIKTGDRVKIDTRSGEYVSKA